MVVFDLRHYTAITFQGVRFPATLMASDVLERILGIEDEELTRWLFNLVSCRGLIKSDPSETCARCSERLLNLMLEQRQRVLDGIQNRLARHGF